LPTGHSHLQVIGLNVCPETLQVVLTHWPLQIVGAVVGHSHWQVVAF
jgi:hypothetical protein